MKNAKTLLCYAAAVSLFLVWMTGALGAFMGVIESCAEDVDTPAPHDGVWLAGLPVISRKMGYGTLGVKGRLGFEERCVSIGGVKRAHSLGMVSFAKYTLFVSFPACFLFLSLFFPCF